MASKLKFISTQQYSMANSDLLHLYTALFYEVFGEHLMIPA